MPQTTDGKKRKVRRPLTPTQQDLAEMFLPLARNMAKPLKQIYPRDWEEFESAACMALVEAAEAFDPGRDVKFSTFARTRIWGALLDVKRRRRVRSRRPDPRGPSNYQLVDPDPSDGHRVLIAAPDGDIGFEFEAIEGIENWLRKLPKNHASTCRQIYLHGKTHSETASAMGLSSSRVSSLHLEALQMLKGTWSGPAPRPGTLQAN
ncbi:hypothetical protein BH23PLA1_BH23PLA1_14300 [soil metagenome]